jgi:hypothetical protein
VDQVGENLKEAEVLFREAGGGADNRATLTTVRSGIVAIAERSGGPFDIIVLSNVLNEMFLRDGDRIKRRTELVRNIMARLLARDGSCIIIEPACRKHRANCSWCVTALLRGTAGKAPAFPGALPRAGESQGLVPRGPPLGPARRGP